MRDQWIRRFPGSGNPIANKDFETIRLNKETRGSVRRTTSKILNLLVAAPSVKFELIKSKDHRLGIKKAYQILKVNRSGHCEFLNHPKFATQIRREAPIPFIEEIFYESKK